ncbi:type I polyketide synthase [Tengunoibacter tsumagoiensis]|uniref:Polyketide synthase n=1 Tax=Tengunoibacter tsumagoiensis TaxID=2014871 RepID=A0A402A9E8_9CHLR|nr:type I polyketide synthase [Tengunoibacter tsumagoiensis]GCE15770.1 polyketide synthase [Tengunoibacter tsumagoiensis]
MNNFHKQMGHLAPAVVDPLLIGGLQPSSPSEQSYDKETLSLWLSEKLAEALALEATTIDFHAPFAHYGVGSAEAIGLSGDLEDFLGYELSPTLLYDYPTIDALARFLAGEEHVPGDEAITVDRLPTNPDAVSNEPIAIIGIGCRFPGDANSPEQFWQLLAEGRDGIIEIPPERWNSERFYDPDPDAPGKMYTRHGGFLPNLTHFDAQFFGISPREATRMDPQQRLLTEVAWEALENAGISVGSLAGSKTGVFVGMMSNSEYTLLQLLHDEDAAVNDPYFGMGSAGSVAAGRLSYLFDLQGPTMTIDTACSSSLVGVHLASQSLRNRECELAIVGGTNAILMPESMINACKMRMLALDGRCKTFDEKADGFALGEGCGVVILKRLSDAVADNNPIQAVIRGSAVNQDGRSNGLTAPNRLSQEEVLRQALRAAQLLPQQISYVEAHGSGTALGDPIEMGALDTVYNGERDPAQPLIVGAVKTNIGHLAGAAGMAGLIKTVLSLQQQAIPVHLNLQTRNPHLAPYDGRITVPTAKLPWYSQDEPRRAGVSSFGWSGTNAHVIIEEAPAVSPVGVPAQPWQAITLSARSATALESMTEQLRAFLEQQPSHYLADIAYSYQQARSALPYRRALVGKDREDLLGLLTTRDPRRMLDGVASTNDTHRLTFLLPGLGDHYVGMGRQLYDHETVFQAAVDECAELLRSFIGLDIRHLLYPIEEQSTAPVEDQTNSGARLDLRKLLHREPVEKGELDLLYQTRYAQPILFVFEYALAQLWKHWGIVPQALIGYSLGEYVAACLAGVFCLEDALKLVATRAELIQQLAPGAMLAIALPEEGVLPFLSETISLAAVNGPAMCVVSGPVEAITQLEAQLQGNDIACQRLQTTHAFHSQMMQPIEGALIKLVQTCHLQPPQIPYLSNVTGNWIRAEEATDPRYWARHLCETVRFSAGIEQLWQQPHPIFLEVGPGQMLSSLFLQHPAGRTHETKVVLTSLPMRQEKRSDRAFQLQTISQLWLAGVSPDWQQLHSEEAVRCISLPSYPFEHQTFWIGQRKASTRQQPSEAKKLPYEDWFYLPTWKRSALPPMQVSEPQEWLVLANDNAFDAGLINAWRAQGHRITTVRAGEAFRRVQDDEYTIQIQVPQDYVALLKHLHVTQKAPQQIVHLWSLSSAPIAGSDAFSASRLKALQQTGFDSLLSLVQALGNLPALQSLQLSVVSNALHVVLGHESLQVEKASLLGMGRVIMQEYPQISYRSIELDPQTNLASQPDQQVQKYLLHDLLTPLEAIGTDRVIAYRAAYRWVQTFEPLTLSERASSGAALREQGVYLITGGLGGLGLAVAEYLAKTVQARLVLVGRSTLPEREQWSTWLAEHSEREDSVSRKLAAIQRLEALGADVLLLSADVADLTQMKSVKQQIQERFGVLHGIIHTAGAPGEGLIQLKTSEMVEKVFAPKITGTLVLDTLFKHDPLDFLLLYSSSNSITGGLGEIDYCAANAFLDAFAQAKATTSSYPILAVNWGPWEWDAWQSRVFASMPEVYAQIKQLRTQFGITFRDGESILPRLLGSGQPQLLVLPQGLDVAFQHAQALSSLAFLNDIQDEKGKQPTHERPDLRTAYVAPRTEQEQKMAEIWQAALGIEKVGLDDHFFELGGNSLIGMVIISQIKKEFSLEVSAASLFEGPTIHALLEILFPQQQEQPALVQNSSRGKLRRERMKRQR